MLGSEWSLRYAFGVFVVATVLAILLPARVDSSAGEVSLPLSSVARGTQRRRARGADLRARPLRNGFRDRGSGDTDSALRLLTQAQLRSASGIEDPAQSLG